MRKQQEQKKQQSYSRRSNKQNNRTQKDLRNKNDRKDLMSSKGELDAEGKNNDPNWYFKDRELADQVSNFSFQSFLGIDDSNSVGLIPTMMVLACQPSPGVTFGYTDADIRVSAALARKGINLSAVKEFYMLSSRSGRGAVYAPSDIAILNLAIGELISTIEHIRRFFGLANVWSIRNRSLAKAVIRQLGIDADDFFNNIAVYRTKANTIIATINQLPIIGSLTYFQKCQDIYQHVYVDAVSPMAQMYAFVPATSWILEEGTAKTGSKLRTVATYSGTHLAYPTTGTAASAITVQGNRVLTDPSLTMGGLLTILNNMVDALLNSSTLNIVYADIINMADKAGVGLWSFDSIKEDYTVVPEYNQNALLQIHNATITGSVSGGNPLTWNNLTALTGFYSRPTPANDVYSDPDKNIVVYQPGFPTINNVATPFKQLMIVDNLTGTPTVEDRIEATRFQIADLPKVTTYNDTGSSTNQQQELGYCLPDHWIIEGLIFYPDNNPNSGMNGYNWMGYNRKFLFDPNRDMDEVVKMETLVSKFDWAPSIPTAVNTSNNRFVGTNQDVNFYTPLSSDWYDRVNDMIFISLFDL